jgi:MFS family permease
VKTGDELAEFDWDSKITSMVLSSFYWMYVVSQVVGGVATQHFGTKAVFGWSQLATAIGSLCIPYAASTHWALLVFVRSVQGFASGLTWPAMYAIVAPWVPPVERSRFMSSFQGFSIGIGLTYPLCGFIISFFGWRPVFYTTGTIGVLWCIMWYYLAFDTPSEHPRISPSELEYIELNVSAEIKEHQGMKVPWKAIFTSLPAWSIGITTFGRIWVHYTFIMQGPAYMKNILNFDIQSNGIISGLPFLASYLSSVIFCYLADVLVKQKILNLTNVRKLMTASSQIIPGLLVVLVGYLGTEIVSVLIIWSIAVTMITASYAGAMANIVDLAPNLAGPVLAFAQTIHMSASFLSPMINGFILTDQKNLLQWQHCFLLSSIVAIVTYVMFQCYGTAEIQPWNYPKAPRSDAERQQLNINGTSKENHDKDDT